MHNIVITGVSSGIGEFVARKFLQEGHRVFGSIRKIKDANSLVADYPDLFYPLIFDVTNQDAIQAGFEKVEETVGEQGIQLLINNAGVAVYGATTLLSLDDYRYQFDVNLFGVIAVTKAFLPLLGATNDYHTNPGKIFNISSVAGGISTPFLAPYCASKCALDGFSHSLRRELLIYGIDVVIISPGAIKTPIWNKVETLSEHEKESDYGRILHNFRKIVLKEAEDSMPAERFADKVFKVYMRNKPKARYIILDKKLIKWIIPKYFLGHRQLDFFFRKMYDKIEKSN